MWRGVLGAYITDLVKSNSVNYFFLKLRSAYSCLQFYLSNTCELDKVIMED